MEFFHRASAGSERKRSVSLAVLPGTFNPITIAHRELARAALSAVDEVLLVLPRMFPHKTYSGASFEARIEMMRAAVKQDPNISIASTQGGLFVEIADECRAAYSAPVRLSFLCGRDAAERIVSWDYGSPDAAVKMLRQFDLLVAARAGEYEPPPEFEHAVRRLEIGRLDHVSATEVRDRIARGAPWEDLVPTEIESLVRRFYQKPVI